MNRLKYLLLVISLCAGLARLSFAQNQTVNTELLFFSNVNASLQNCGCGEPPLGGIAQMIPIIAKKRQKNPQILVVDGGDFFNSYSYPDLNHAVLDLYQRLHPELVALGDQELIEGLSFLKQNNRFFKKSSISSNTVIPGINTNKAYLSEKNTPLYFLSWLDPSAFDIIKKPKFLKFNEHTFDTLYKKRDKNQILIVVFHGAVSAIQKFITAYPEIDILLLAHAQSNIKELKKRPFIIGGGADGEYIKDIFITRSAGKIQIDVKDIPVTMDVKPDAEALKIIDKWQIK